jgi:hypothetical protein
VFFKALKSIFGGREKSTTPEARENAVPDRSSFVAFVVDVEEPYFLGTGERFESNQASMRLRVAIPARELARRVSVCLVPIDYFAGDPRLSALGTVRAIVVGKAPVRFFAEQPQRADALVSWVETMASRQRVVVDFSDDLAAAAAMYSQPALIDFQRRLLRACPATVSSNALRERLAREASYPISVIEDPYEAADAKAPRFVPGATLRLLWFGVFGPPLRALVEEQFATIARRITGRPLELVFVTYAFQASLVAEVATVLREINPDFRVRHVAWSVETTASELERADLVVLPQDAGAWGRVKSHNRLVEAIRAGRFAIVSPIPSYLELENYAWVGEDLSAGVEWALNHPGEVERRLIAGQAYVAQRFAPARIAEKWAQALGIDAAAPS